MKEFHLVVGLDISRKHQHSTKMTRPWAAVNTVCRKLYVNHTQTSLRHMRTATTRWLPIAAAPSGWLLDLMGKRPRWTPSLGGA